jgi:iron complex transport system substrate-binding protein
MTKVVCLIPSITETLINCGVEVIGRTRFCIHPIQRVENIQVVGGTKDVKWEKLSQLQPGLVILDKEENTLEMAESCPYPYLALHITDIHSLFSELSRLADELSNKALQAIANRWLLVSKAKPLNQPDFNHIPGAISYLDKNNQTTQHSPIKSIDYMIWKDPWMAIGPNTFIWSVLLKLGFEKYLISRTNKYPNIDNEPLPNTQCFYLFSSEPFPFEKHHQQLIKLGFKGAIIDGEHYSWYGTRSLAFLETQLSLN